MPIPRQQLLQQAAQPVAQPQSIEAPVTGWNARDALTSMEPTDAVVLDNFYPDYGGVFVRNGYQSFATGLGSGAVETLAEYRSNAATKLLGACGGSIFDCSAGGAVGAALGTGFGSDRWQTVNFNNLLFMFNGVDTPQAYNGSTLADPGFTGVTESSLFTAAVYQQRLYIGQNGAAGFWYAGSGYITGALTYYDLSTLTARGGYLVAITTMSHDGGNGVQDFIVFIMSSGDALIYFGDDPSNATVWSMVGQYRISPPVSPRACCNYGAESFLTTFDDHVPLQQQLVALKVGSLPPRSKVSGAVQQAVALNPNGFGWQALYYPAGRRLLFNIPNVDGTFDQHVYNTATQAWCRFTNMNASCWSLFGNGLYFGGAAGVVYQADTGNMDANGAVMATAQQAWNVFDNPLRKRVTAVRPVIQGTGSVAYQFGVGFDYQEAIVETASAVPGGGSPWDTSPWDTSPWSPEAQIDVAWKIAGGSGQAVGFFLNIAAATAVSWLRTDFRYELGSAL